MHRLHVPFPEPAPATLRLTGDPHHHLAHVLRAQVGTELELFDGMGRTCRARVLRLDDDGAELSLADEQRALPIRPVTLVQGLPKGERWDLVLQKGTELGAAAFFPVASERTIVKIAPDRTAERQARWQKVAAEAARQCGRADVPQVAALQSLEAAIAALPHGTRLVILDEEERTRTLRAVLDDLAPGLPLAFAIGPEGGWSRAEVGLLEQRGGVAVTIGPRVLRTETVPLYVLSVVGYLTLSADK